jgi:hypothetical protein
VDLPGDVLLRYPLYKTGAKPNPKNGKGDDNKDKIIKEENRKKPR